MTYTGTVKDGRLELEQPLSLPDGTAVQVEVIPKIASSIQAELKDELWAEWDKLAQDVADSSRGSRSILETLAEMRR